MSEAPKVLLVVANRDFNRTEYIVPKEIFEKNGFIVVTAAGEKGNCYSKSGVLVNAEKSLGEIDADEYSAIVYVGGDGVEGYFHDDRALGLAKTFNSMGKPTCAICFAPVVLANAGVLSYKKATVWEGAEKNLEMVDATYTGKNVTVDGNIVTANGPAAAEEFAERIVELLSR